MTRRTGFEATLTAVANGGRDADITGAVAGGLPGVRDGAGCILERWARAVLAGPRMRQLAREITSLRRVLHRQRDPTSTSAGERRPVS